MEILSEVIAVINSGFFAGAALAISLSEHLARQNMDPQQGLIHFQQSHKRIAPVLKAAALSSTFASLHLADVGGEAKQVYLAAGFAMAAMQGIPTILAMSASDRLLSAEQKGDAEIKELFGIWGMLHAVRTVVSILTFTGLAFAALMTAKQ